MPLHCQGVGYILKRISNYCQQDRTQICKLCMKGNHTGHELESLEVTADRLDSVPVPGLHCHRYHWHTSDIGGRQTENENRHSAGAGGPQDNERHCSGQRDSVSQQGTRNNWKPGSVEHLEIVQKSLENQQLFAEALQIVKRMVYSVKGGQEKILGCLNAACQDQQTTAKKAQSNIEKLENTLQDTMAKFTVAAEKLKGMKILVAMLISHLQRFYTPRVTKCLKFQRCGTRCYTGIKLYSGKQIELETLVWEFGKCQAEEKLFSAIELRETLVESLGGDEGSLSQSLQHVCTIPVSCASSWGVRPIQLFDQHFILHACTKRNSDKICIHDATGAVRQLLSVPEAKLCGSPVVVDSGTGLMVVADRVQDWTNEMQDAKSKTHLSGTLH